MTKFELGDIVRLKAGSPRLVVSQRTDHYLIVKWIGYVDQKPYELLAPVECFRRDH